MMQIKAILITLFTSVFISAFSQEQSTYTIPIPTERIAVSTDDAIKLSNDKEVLAFTSRYLALQNWDALAIQLAYERQSLGGSHYTFQVYFKEIPVAFCQVKVHLSKDAQAFLIQHNIPAKEVWNTYSILSPNKAENSVLLLEKDNAVLAERTRLIDEQNDIYADRFTLSDGRIFENSLKAHADSTVHVAVFKPNPITSASQNYGGLYQDSYTKDTTVLVIQSQTNPGGGTVTFNSSNYTFNGQQFSINTESYQNSFSGTNLFQYFSSIRFNGLGAVLGYNTAVSDDLTGINTQLITEDYNYSSLANEQVWEQMPVDFTAGVFSLKNEAFEIAEVSAPVTNIATSIIDSFNFTRNELAFEDVNALYHLSNYKNYWESLGFSNLAQEVILVDAHGNNGADNSFFTSTSPPRLVFGQGGVDDAEDADVVIHEYAHAISYFAAPGSNVGSERNALDEGYGDYLAASYSYGLSTYNWDWVFSWDGHNEFWPGRFANTAKTALDITANENIYFNGEIWATVLTDLLLSIDKETADKLAIETMYYNMPNTTIYEAALNLFKADSTVFNGLHRCAIYDVLENRKFLVGNCSNFISSIADSYESTEAVKLLNSADFSHAKPLQLKLENSSFAKGSYVVVDASGKQISQAKIESQVQRIPTQNWLSGVYFIVLKTNSGTYRFKVVKQD